MILKYKHSLTVIMPSHNDHRIHFLSCNASLCLSQFLCHCSADKEKTFDASRYLYDKTPRFIIITIGTVNAFYFQQDLFFVSLSHPFFKNAQHATRSLNSLNYWFEDIHATKFLLKWYIENTITSNNFGSDVTHW